MVYLGWKLLELTETMQEQQEHWRTAWTLSEIKGGGALTSNEEQRWFAGVLWSDQVDAAACVVVAVGGRGGGARALVRPREGEMVKFLKTAPTIFLKTLKHIQVINN